MPKAVYFLMLPNVLLLDVSGPAEVLRLTGQFPLHYVSPVPQITCSIGMTIGQLAPLPQQWNKGDILVIPGVADSTHYFASEEAALARNWLRALRPALAQRQIDLVCVCSGALLAAQAGLLDGYHCTTHHAVLDRLRQQAPAAQVKENRIFVEDRGVFTSAGITAGIDLALHLVNQHCGADRALEIAREMVVYFRRSGDDPQLSPGYAIAIICILPCTGRRMSWPPSRRPSGRSPRWRRKPTSAAAIWPGCSACISASAYGNIMNSYGWRSHSNGCNRATVWKKPR